MNKKILSVGNDNTIRDTNSNPQKKRKMDSVLSTPINDLTEKKKK
jgi:hypothetical protein